VRYAHGGGLETGDKKRTREFLLGNIVFSEHVAAESIIEQLERRAKHMIHAPSIKPLVRGHLAILLIQVFAK
jgi:hypothetical protein